MVNATITHPAGADRHIQTEDPMVKLTNERTTHERRIIRELRAKDRWVGSVWIGRRSDREFDLSIEGVKHYGSSPEQTVRFTAWLPLAAISTLTNWASWQVGELTDYPEMTAGGDWSGVHDTSPSGVWTIFDLFVVQDLERSIRWKRLDADVITRQAKKDSARNGAGMVKHDGAPVNPKANPLDQMTPTQRKKTAAFIEMRGILNAMPYGDREAALHTNARLVELAGRRDV